MNENRDELISALLDGELEPGTAEQTVSGLLRAGSEDLDRFGRYRMIGDVMRGESAVNAASVVHRVRDALVDEPVVLAPKRRAPVWLKPAAGVAIAASVAAVAVVVTPQLITPAEVQGGIPVQLAADVPPPVVRPALVAVGAEKRTAQADGVSKPARWQTLNDELAGRLNRLVIEHHEFGGRTGLNGPVSHISFVGYDAR